MFTSHVFQMVNCFSYLKAFSIVLTVAWDLVNSHATCPHEDFSLSLPFGTNCLQESGNLLLMFQVGFLKWVFILPISRWMMSAYTWDLKSTMYSMMNSSVIILCWPHSWLWWLNVCHSGFQSFRAVKCFRSWLGYSQLWTTCFQAFAPSLRLMSGTMADCWTWIM